MATLSKMVIENITERMTSKSKKYADAMLKEYEQVVAGIFESQIPDEVKKVFKSHPDYIKTATEAYLDGHGFNRESVCFGKSLPAVSNYRAALKLTAAIADRIMKHKRKYEKAKEDYKLLVRETEAALTALKTHKNIRENLPEAIPFLPPPMSNSLVVNFESLQKKLQKQPEVKSATPQN